MDLKLRNKTALVTGGGHGLGKAVCTVLAEEGVSLVINYNKRLPCKNTHFYEWNSRLFFQ